MMKRFSNEMRPTTIRDVAKRAGVSVAAASYALNNTGRISAVTKEIVLKAAQDLGYTPSMAAQVLKGGKGNLIAILTEGFAGPWYGELLEGIQPTLSAQGKTVLALTMQKEALALCRSLVDAGWIRGLIVLNPGSAWAETLLPMMDTVPTAVFDPDEQYRNTLQYAVDNRGGISTLMDHLWERGYRDFLWLDGDTDLAWDARERYQAFSDYLTEKQLPREAHRRLKGGFRVEIAYEAVRTALSLGQRPRAIVAANDESAIGALRAVTEAGFQVPQQIAITGFDGLDGSQWTAPPLTTLRFDRRKLGAQMAADLLSVLGNGRPEPKREIIPVNLLIRASS